MTTSKKEQLKKATKAAFGDKAPSTGPLLPDNIKIDAKGKIEEK